MGEERFQQDVYDWLNTLELSRPKRNLARDFSDGVYVAEILKKTYPRMVDLHNYNSANAFCSKLANWTLLNDKVLHKLGIGLPKNLLKEIASANKLAVEKMLLTIKKKLDEENERKLIELSDEAQKITDVPYEEYKRLIEELNQKKEQIESLKSKVSHLEVLLSFKEQRVQDLTSQVRVCTCHRVS